MILQLQMPHLDSGEIVVLRWIVHTAYTYNAFLSKYCRGYEERILYYLKIWSL